MSDITVYPIFANTVVYGSPITSIPIAFSTYSDGMGDLYSYVQVIRDTIGVYLSSGGTYSTTTQVGSYTITTEFYRTNSYYSDSGITLRFKIPTQDYTKSLSISKATLTIYPIFLGTFNYGSTLPNLYQYVTGFMNSETTSVITGWPKYATCATTLNSSTPAGTYIITPNISGLSSKNYTFTAGTNASVTITKATLVISSISLVFPVGTSTFLLTQSVTGFMNSETTSVITGWPVYATCATTLNSSTPAGTYIITPNISGLSSTNYTFTAGTNATITISNTSLTVLPKPNQFKNLSTTPDISYSFYDSQNNLVNPLISSGVVSWQTSTGATITSTTTSGVYSISYNGNLTSSNNTFISGTPVNFTVLAPLTHFQVKGTDLNQIFQPKTSGNIASETNFNSIENLFEPL